MKAFLLLVLNLAFVSISAQASPPIQNYCTLANLRICVHMDVQNTLTTTEEGKFTLAIATPNAAPVENLKVNLYMDMMEMQDMGHGSAPLTITDLGNNHFQVSNAWFVMTGPWKIQTHFDAAGTHADIDIPVQIDQ